MSAAASELDLWAYLNPIDEAELHTQFQSATPTRYFCIDNFLRPEFARELAEAYPSFEDAKPQGREFKWTNERVKVQITDSGRFPEPVARLHEIVASSELRSLLGRITEIPDLDLGR